MSQAIFALAAIDAVLLFLFDGRSILDAFQASRDVLLLLCLQLVIMAAGFMILLQRKRQGVGLLLVAVYVVAREAMVGAILTGS